MPPVEPVANVVTLTELTEAMQLLELAHVDFGTLLAEEGAKDPTLMYILAGEVEAVSGDVQVGVFHAGSMLGQSQVFADQPWPTSLKATRPTALLLAPVEAYERLRQKANPLAWALERAALAAAVALLSELDGRIRALAEGVVLKTQPHTPPHPGRRGLFGRVLGSRQTGPGGATDRLGFLRSSGLFRDADPAIVGQLAEYLSPLRYRAGSFLATFGEPSEWLYLLAQGRVDVLLPAADGRHEPVATLEAGSMFGMMSMLQGRPHQASIVGHEEVLAYGLEKEACLEVVRGDELGGTVLRRALLRALAEQTILAQSVLARLDHRNKEAIRRDVAEKLYVSEPEDEDSGSSRLDSGRLVLPS